MERALFEARRAEINQEMGMDPDRRAIVKIGGAAGLSGETRMSRAFVDGPNVVVELTGDNGDQWLLEMTPDQGAAFLGAFAVGEQSRQQGRRSW